MVYLSRLRELVMDKEARALPEASKLIREKCPDLGPDPQQSALPPALQGGLLLCELSVLTRPRSSGL